MIVLLSCRAVDTVFTTSSTHLRRKRFETLNLVLNTVVSLPRNEILDNIHRHTILNKIETMYLQFYDIYDHTLNYVW